MELEEEDWNIFNADDSFSKSLVLSPNLRKKR